MRNVGKFHQKFELRKASGLDSWKAVPTPTFQLDLRPCHFTNGYGLMGVQCTAVGRLKLCMSSSMKQYEVVHDTRHVILNTFLNFTTIQR